MDVKEMRTLRLLEAIDNNHSHSQRDLAKTLGVSLGLVNSFLRRLAKKGYFKITHFPRNRISYILTPKGAAEKSRLTYAYLQMSFQFYRDARRKIRSLFYNLQNQDARSVAFFGTGNLAEIAYLSLQDTNLHFAGIVDDTGAGADFLGHPVLDLNSLTLLSFDVVLITKDEGDNGMHLKLLSAGIQLDKIVTL